MADYRVKVSTDELRQAVTRFNSCKAEIIQAYSNMLQDAMQLKGTWEGPASQAFVQSFNELIANIRTSDGTIEQAVTGLEKAAGIYEQFESESVKLSQGMTEAPDFAG